MEYRLVQLPKSELEIEVIIPFSEFEPQIKRAAALISEDHDIEGFRRGKAPYEVVKNKFGEQAIYERAAKIAVRASYPETMTGIRNKESPHHPDKSGGAGQAGIRDGGFTPIGRPEITIAKLAPGNELRYKVKVATLPEVTLPDWRAIAKRVRENEKKDVSVSEGEVEDTIQWLRESRAPLVTVARGAERGDSVEVDFEVRHGGVKIADGESKSHPLILGKGKFLPGFEEAILNMKAGEKNEFSLIAPEDWHEKSLAGKPLDFNVILKSVQERRLPELNDEFAKGLGNFSSVDALRQSIRDGIGADKQEKEKQRVRALMIETVAQEAKMEIPEVLISGELDKMFSELKSGAESMGLKWEDYLLHIKRTPEELRKEWKDEAEKRVRTALVLREIAAQEKIEVTEEETWVRADQYLRKYKSAEESAQDIDPVRSHPDRYRDADVHPVRDNISNGARSHRTSNGVDPRALKEYLRGVIKNEKVFEILEHV